MFKMMTGGSRP